MDQQTTEHRPCLIRLIGLASMSAATPFDNQYLVEYDPTRPGHDLFGRPMTAHIVTTADPAQATVFADAAAAFAAWRAPSGLPYPRNAPLTAYTIELVPTPEVGRG
jgi:hypothetical protein